MKLIPIVLDPELWPVAVRNHFNKRVAERFITLDDMKLIKVWAMGRPHAQPYEEWFHTFTMAKSPFTIVGRGQYPLSVLDRGKGPHGRKLAWGHPLLVSKAA